MRIVGFLLILGLAAVSWKAIAYLRDEGFKLAAGDTTNVYSRILEVLRRR